MKRTITLLLAVLSLACCLTSCKTVGKVNTVSEYETES
jgi:predicted small secreted protein